MTGARLSCPGDACLSVDFAENAAGASSTIVIDPAVNARCVALAATLEHERRTGVRDVVPGFHTVTIHFDPLQIDRHTLAADVQRAIVTSASMPVQTAAPLEIPARYGAEDGPDLADVAAFAGCSEAEVIRLHSQAAYRVYMLGFLPGFAYLGSVDRRIGMPRLETPRARVATGSVGIAGVQTGIYPCDTPGGWRIIGRTPVGTFDLTRPAPSLFSPGQRVQFVVA